MPKGQRKYNGTQKVEIIERIRSEQLSFHEASREYDVPRRTLQDWERIYLTEGPEGFAIEHRGRGSTGRQRKLPKEVEEDLLAEMQRLRAENEYLKKLDALVMERKKKELKK